MACFLFFSLCVKKHQSMGFMTLRHFLLIHLNSQMIILFVYICIYVPLHPSYKCFKLHHFKYDCPSYSS